MPQASHRRLDRLLLWAMAIVFLLLGWTPGQGQAVSEYQVKAAYLYNFAKFIEWPGQAFPEPDAPLQLCVFSRNPFGSDLGRIVRGKVIAGHPVRIVSVESAELARGCHILFVDSSQDKQLKSILGVLHGASVLTVGENRDFVQEGGMINFVLQDDQVHFEINQRAAEQAQILISSRLLSVARTVIK